MATAKRKTSKAKRKTSARSTAKKRAAKQRVAKKRVAKKRGARKKTAKKRPATVKVAEPPSPLSEAAQGLHRQVEEMQRALHDVVVHHLEARNRALQTSVKARLERTAGNIRLSRGARNALDRAKLRRAAMVKRIQDVRSKLSQQMREDLATARREAAAQSAVDAFREKFLRDYDRKQAQSSRRRTKKKRKKKAS